MVSGALAVCREQVVPPLPYSGDWWEFVYLKKPLKIAFSDFSALRYFHLNIPKCELIKSEFRFSFLEMRIVGTQ